MQKIGMYTYYDKKAERYDTPFFTLLDVHAERKFIMDAKNKETMIGNFKDHYVMIKIAEFDVVNGKLEIFNRQIIEGNQIVIDEEDE